MTNLLSIFAGIMLLFVAAEIRSELISGILFYIGVLGFMVIIPLWTLLPGGGDGLED